jgi:PilZ domain
MDRILQFPVPSREYLAVAAAILLGFIILAILIEFFRQRRQRTARTSAAWHTIDEILDEKQVSQAERHLLARIIRKHSPDDPLRPITVRQQFDHCVEAHMNGLKAPVTNERFAQAGAQLRDIREALALDYVPVGQRICSTRELHEGQSLWLALASDTKPRWFQGNVASLDEASVRVTLHEDERKPEFRIGNEVRCRLWREDDARYMLNVRYVAYDPDSETYTISHTSNMRRLQARAHYRVRHEQGTPVAVLNRPVDDNFKKIHERQPITKSRGRITNLSAGGCALVLRQSVPLQVLLRITLEMEDTAPIEVIVAIVGTSPISGGRYLVRGRFVAIDEETRDEIARYIVHRQQPVGKAEAAAE